MIWFGPAMAIIFSNIAFGLAHPHSPTYVILVFFVGIYLGITLHFTENQNLLVPMIVHALYDFAAFLVIKKEYLDQVQGSENI